MQERMCFPASARLAVKRPTLHVNRIKTRRKNKDTLPDKLYTYDDRQGGISIKKPQKSHKKALFSNTTKTPKKRTSLTQNDAISLYYKS